MNDSEGSSFVPDRAGTASRFAFTPGDVSIAEATAADFDNFFPECTYRLEPLQNHEPDKNGTSKIRKNKNNNSLPLPFLPSQKQHDRITIAPAK